jgi:phosphoglycolate phosphatase-like HAD superfamily hydrolase
MMSDGLNLWTNGPAKREILDFVAGVTDPDSPAFVPPEQRIATFDNDGTLWCEKPMYVQADFLIRRLKQMADEDPAKRDIQPWKAVYEGDREWLGRLLEHVPDLIAGVTEAYEGITTQAFEEAAREFFDTAKHPTLGVPYTHLAYRPMLQLIEFLSANGFGVYICSAGGRDFVRVIAQEVYGLSRDRVIGSATTLEYRDGEIYRTRGIEQPIDDGPGKPVNIWARTGRAPLFAGGNADGDSAMLETATFALLVRHDDATREFAYDAGAENVLAEAAARGWTVASMAGDFAQVF